MRVNPHTNNLLRLQNYKRENPNRAFHNFSESNALCTLYSENRELIPDIFCGIEYMINLNCNYFGRRSDTKLVDDMFFKTCNKYNESNGDKSTDISSEKSNENDNNENDLIKYTNFLINHRKLLNSKIIDQYIPKWIDYIFGVNQLNTNIILHIFVRYFFD